LGVWLFTSHLSALIGLIVFGLLLIPTSATFHCEQGWTRKTMTIYTITIAALGCVSVILSLLGNTLWVIPIAFFLLSVASSWVATLLSGIKPKK
jgi:hypothetical protein